MDEKRHVPPGQNGQGLVEVGLRHAREILYAGIDEKCLESQNARVNEAFELSGVARDDAAPKTAVGPELALRGFKLGRKRGGPLVVTEYS